MQLFYWIQAIIIAAAAGYWVYTRDKRRAVPFPWLTSLLRSLVVFLTLLLILVPTILITKNVTEKPIVLLLQDNSRSIAAALGPDSTAYRKNLAALAEKLSSQYKVVQWGFGGGVQADSAFKFNDPATDISAALSRAQEYFGLQNLGAVVLATDGRFNQGMNPVYQQLSIHSPMYAVAIGDSTVQKDIRISRVYANKVVTINSDFEIRADIVADLCRNYNNAVSIKEANEPLSTVPIAISVDKYDRAVSFTIKAGKAGLHHYIISVPDADGEKNTSNNHKDVFVEVVDQKKNILIISAAPHPDINAIKEALSGMQTYKVTVASADAIPASFAEYNVIIAHGLPSIRTAISSKLLSSRKPVWFILSNQTDLTGLNSLDQLTHTTIHPAAPHDVQAAYNPSFNTFILPQNIQAIADKMPPLVMSAANVAAAPGSSVLFSQKLSATQPLWILQQGSVPTALLLGEGLWRWRLYEYKNFNQHTVIDECIRQTVAFLSANNSERPFNVVLPRYVWSDQETISMNAYMLNANNEQVNTPDVQLTITDSASRKQNFSFERSGSAYSLNIGVWAGGTYTYTAKTTYNDKTYTASGSFAVEAVPVELMETGADYPFLYSLARKYNGGLVPARNILSLADSITRNERVKPVIQTNTETVPLVDRKWYFFLILLFAVAEWLLRKYWLAQ